MGAGVCVGLCKFWQIILFSRISLGPRTHPQHNQFQFSMCFVQGACSSVYGSCPDPNARLYLNKRGEEVLFFQQTTWKIYGQLYLSKGDDNIKERFDQKELVKGNYGRSLMKDWNPIIPQQMIAPQQKNDNKILAESTKLILSNWVKQAFWVSISKCGAMQGPDKLKFHSSKNIYEKIWRVLCCWPRIFLYLLISLAAGSAYFQVRWGPNLIKWGKWIRRFHTAR